MIHSIECIKWRVFEIDDGWMRGLKYFSIWLFYGRYCDKEFMRSTAVGGNLMVLKKMVDNAQGLFQLEKNEISRLIEEP